MEREALKITITNHLKDVVIVGEADNGRDAVQLCEKLQPDMVFLDIRMPGINGFEVSKTLKSKRKDLIVVFYTAYVDEESIQKGMNALGDEYLAKPARPEQIIEMIDKYLQLPQSSDRVLNHQKKKLVEEILRNDYRESKKILDEMIRGLMESTSWNITDFKSICKEFAEEVTSTLEWMDLKGKSSKQIQEDYFYEIEGITDAYAVKAWIFKILDAVFERIVSNRPRESANVLTSVMNYIERNLHKKISLEGAAEYVNMSPFYLSKIFKKETGINFIDYIAWRKIEKAKELLEFSEIPVMNIALELSYDEPNYFSKVFRKLTGVTPSEYRQQKQIEGALSNRGYRGGRNITIRDVKWYV